MQTEHPDRGSKIPATAQFSHWSLPLLAAWLSGNFWMFAEVMKMPGIFDDEPFLKTYVKWSARVTAAIFVAAAIWLQKRRNAAISNVLTERKE